MRVPFEQLRSRLVRCRPHNRKCAHLVAGVVNAVRRASADKACHALLRGLVLLPRNTARYVAWVVMTTPACVSWSEVAAQRSGAGYSIIRTIDTGAYRSFPVWAFQASGRSQNASLAKLAAAFLPQLSPDTVSQSFVADLACSSRTP